VPHSCIAPDLKDTEVAFRLCCLRSGRNNGAFRQLLKYPDIGAVESRAGISAGLGLWSRDEPPKLKGGTTDREIRPSIDLDIRPQQINSSRIRSQQVVGAAHVSYRGREYIYLN
jgi:hypothetical protein